MRVKSSKNMITILAIAMLMPSISNADVVSDGSLGSAVNLVGMDFQITGGTTAGTNLFHSFSSFDLTSGESGSFSGAVGIQNIIARVTNGLSSSIDGQINSSIAGANLFLINPAGIAFGSNASLNVLGSVHFSTADYVSLGNDGRFNSSTSTSSVLTTSAPSAFGYLGAPAAINFNGGLFKVPDTEEITVSAGDITIVDASLLAKDGRINLASLGSAGELVINANSLDTSSFSSLGNISITHTGNQATRPIDGTLISNLHVSGPNGGDVYISSGNFVSDNAYVFADTLAGGSGGTINFNVSNNITLNNESTFSIDSVGGDNGNIVVNATSLDILTGSRFSALRIGGGNSGGILLNLSNNLNISSLSIASSRLSGNLIAGIFAENVAGGGAGVGRNIIINANDITVSELGNISVSTFNADKAGNVTINANNLTLVSGATIVSDSGVSATGDGGAININLKGQLSINGSFNDPLRATPGESPVLVPDGNGGFMVQLGGTLSLVPSAISSSTLNNGDAGSIAINAGIVSIANSAEISANTGSVASNMGTGNAGNIDIQTRDLNILSGARISSFSATANADAATISLNATETITVSGSGAELNSGVFSSYTISGGGGASGDININASDIIISNEATIATSSIAGVAGGDAGTINLRAKNNVSVLSNSVIASTAESTGGGLINIVAKDFVLLVDSDINTFVNAGAGNGGNVNIGQIETGVNTFLVEDSFAPNFLILQNSSITAKAQDGNGGNINISAGTVLVDDSRFFNTGTLVGSGQVFDPTSEFGLSGDVSVQNPDTSIAGKISSLPDNFLDATRLLRKRCQARSGESTLSLVVSGQGGLPQAPNDYLEQTYSLPISAVEKTSVFPAEIVLTRLAMFGSRNCK